MKTVLADIIRGPRVLVGLFVLVLWAVVLAVAVTLAHVLAWIEPELARWFVWQDDGRMTGTNWLATLPRPRRIRSPRLPVDLTMPGDDPR